MPAFGDPAVAEVFSAHPRPVRTKLMQLRKLIFDTAATTDGVGALQEALKWGQPSYLTPETKSGSTIRIDATKDGSGRYALYFNCNSSLVESFRARYRDRLTFQSNRAIVFDADGDFPVEAVRHCIAMALTYHVAKARGKRTGRAK